MARHLHHRHHGLGLLYSDEISPVLKAQPVQLRQIINSPISHAKSLFARTPPGVSGDSDSSSSSGSSNDFADTGDTGDTSDSSDSSDSSGSSDSSSSDSSSSSGGGSSSEKKGHQGVNISIPVALGVIIPLLLAIVLFFYLHRRHVRKLRQEDANDPHKSLDFGWDPTNNNLTKKRGKSQKKGKPDIIVNEIALEKGSGRDRGLSMDMDVGSPYLMPPGLHGSRESLHSMSRTIHSQDDRYRPATTYIPGDSGSIHSQRTRPGADDSSSQAGSSSMRRGGRDDMKQELLGNAQRMSRSMPPVNRTPIPEIHTPDAVQEMPRKPIPSNPPTTSGSGLAPNAGSVDTRDSYQPNEHLRNSNNYLGAFIHSRDPSADVKSPETEKSEYLTPKEAPATPSSTFQNTETSKSPPPVTNPSTDPSRPSRHQSLQSSHHASIQQNFYEESSDYGDAFKVTPASPRSSSHDQHSNNRGSSQEYMPSIDEYSLGVNESDFGYDVRRLSGVRPLPPEDPLDNPEQRANRIRSFYKEYFDDSKPGPSGPEYYEDYDENYLGDGAIFDPVSGQYVTAQSRPYAEPHGRRAMTPPPRVGGRRHAATMSGSSRLMPPGPRAYSSASGRTGPPGRGPPKKKLPPPKALRVVPTPHLLKEGDFGLAMDFAPPSASRGQRAGAPDSPLGGLRPYSPSVRPHTPLARSYDDLAVMPSPHLLRKSGTFTALDFAPPPRFKNSDTASDAGSIRSNRSAMSARTQNAVRTGAYRVSRIPKEVVGTRGDLMDSLKPQWNMHNNTGTIGMTAK